MTFGLKMAKESGLGANLYVDGYDLSGDTNSVGTISKSLSPLPMTGINKLAMERKAGLLNGRIAWSSFFNPTNAHVALSDLPRTDRIVTYLHRETLGTPAASCVAKQISYNPNRGSDGSLLLDVEALSNAYWLDWGLSLTAGLRTDTTATNGTGVDFGAAGSFGLQAYLHAVSFTGTNCTITVQQSSDNGSGDAFANVTGGSFTEVTSAPFAERIATARDQAVERYLRVVTTGTFTSIVFSVSVTVNRTALVI